ncbi:LLM class flavin-dependent oxidoreductase [Variovorax sp. J22G73]|uniref:LLM class flavin-dependent oxidoreductase n=1 Tax=unclassified Variovorax TaxID=663243 RepID=UPI002574D5C6|nr:MULTISPECIES: LLM class flavin-dependent oxidoreductase [unclassified Variovorax]MDM0005807.1 LLM class flavin-dependent oxidoreductase [Variovorax sp. J22R203]MDM0099834.1 LLM class flavin-dependent oxidoreductase [Variovorax sp. J22G73]
MSLADKPRAPLILNGFGMNVVGHVSAGLWRHPRDQAHRYTTLAYWVKLAKLLERGGFDGMFLADAVGHLDVYGGNADASLRTAAQSPVNDPLLLVSAMAAATEHLGFGITVSTTYEQPYLLARKFSTLDHLTRGRIAWNVVTSMLESAARNLGLGQQIDHDERYDRAQEFLEVTYKLWEGSWEEGAVVRDRERGVYTDPSKVHPIRHKGRWYDVPGAHLSEPSPQRTPVIYQAGTSPRGKLFAALNAEVIFLGGTNPAAIRRSVDAIRAQAVALGRAPDAIKFITAVSVVAAATDAQAEEKYRDYLSYTSTEAALALFSAWTGVDWSAYPADHPLEYIETNASRSILAALSQVDAGRRWTVGGIAEYIGIGGIHPTLVGGPAKVADELEALAEAAGVDGFNLAYAISPGSFEEFVEFVVPELRARGRIKPRAERPLTLRERLHGEGHARLRDDHPGAVFRSLSQLAPTPSSTFFSEPASAS